MRLRPLPPPQRPGTGRRSGPHLPVPHVDHHVVLVAHADDELPVGGERHARHAVLVLQQLADLHALTNVPDPHRWQVTALWGRGRGGGRGQGMETSREGGATEMEANTHKRNQFLILIFGPTRRRHE